MHSFSIQMGVQIRQASIGEVVDLSLKLDEFVDPHKAPEYERRLLGVPHLILVAEWEGEPCGFKVGYERGRYFYSWMGGVLEGFRRRGIAKALSDRMEAWASNAGYELIRLKTRNGHKAMLVFALLNGYSIVGLEKMHEVASHRILLEKKLTH